MGGFKPIGSASSWGQVSTAKFISDGSPIGVITPTGVGDLCSDFGTPAMWQATGLTDTDWDQIGASGQGSSVTHKAPITYNMAGILTGADLVFGDGYVPAVGDILENVWLEIDTAWNGMTPMGDVGFWVAGAMSGWFYDLASNALDMTKADADGGTGVLTGTQGSDLVGQATLYQVASFDEVSGAGPALQQVTNATNQVARNAPAKFVKAAPIKIVVSQDGTPSGANPGSTQGSGFVYVTTSTPA